MEEIKGDDFTQDNYFANHADIEEVEIECDVKYEYLTEEDHIKDLSLNAKRKGSDEVKDPCYSQVKRRRLSVITENHNVVSMAGDPVTEVYAEYDDKSNMFTRYGQKMDLISMLTKLSQNASMGSDECCDPKETIMEKLKSSAFFTKHRQLLRSCSEDNSIKFDKTDPTLPEGFRVKENFRGDGKRVDKEYLNKEGTIVLRSRTAVTEYMNVVFGDDSEINSSQIRNPSKVFNISPKSSVSGLSTSTDYFQGNPMVEVHLKTSTDGGGDAKDNYEVERLVTIATPDQINSRTFYQEEVTTPSSCSTSVTGKVPMEKLKNSLFFSKHRKLIRSCSEDKSVKFDKTDPTLPEGFRVKETIRGDGKRVDKEYLNKEGTIVLRSRTAVREYMKVVFGDDSEI